MSNWKVYAKKADFKGIGEQFGIDQVTARIIRNRNVAEADMEEYLRGGIQFLHNPWLMKDMEKAAAILQKKIAAKEKIRIIGDYDMDGICSIYILYTGLIRLGADVDYVVPDRITDGYGINEHLIDRAKEAGVDTVITCDNGIAAKEAVLYGKKLGMTMIITDHHDIPFVLEEDGSRREELPVADAIVNPKQSDCRYPFKLLCGAGVAWKLMQAMWMGEQVQKELPSELRALLEFVAIATVGDIVDLIGENRTLVKLGLESIHAGTFNLGLATLIRVCDVDMQKFNSYHIGFVVGPCLNASGRLDTAAKAIELLLTSNQAQATAQAQYLYELNDERKQMTEQGTEEAIAAVTESAKQKAGQIEDVLVVYLKNCHESVAGIIAGRVREVFYRPTIVFTNSMEEKQILKGSGRSVEGFNLFEHISGCKELLSKFGGHPMAAGMSMPIENLEKFRAAMNAGADMSAETLTPVKWIDVPMTVDYVTEELIQQFAVLQPFGKANEKPLFADRNLLVERVRILGRNANVLKLTLKTAAGAHVDAIRFRASAEEINQLQPGRMIMMTYYPDLNEYNGKTTIQFIVEEFKINV